MLVQLSKKSLQLTNLSTTLSNINFSSLQTLPERPTFATEIELQSGVNAQSILQIPWFSLTKWAFIRFSVRTKFFCLSSAKGRTIPFHGWNGIYILPIIYFWKYRSQWSHRTIKSHLLRAKSVSKISICLQLFSYSRETTEEREMQTECQNNTMKNSCSTLNSEETQKEKYNS